ncbi:Lrp/AsnC ligand binding domain-containing protein [candidate division KSB1 bacterium]
MSISAYVLIEALPGSNIEEIVNRISDMDMVMSVSGVIGPFDIVANVKADDIASLTRSVAEEIRNMGGIARTLTLPCVIT